MKIKSIDAGFNIFGMPIYIGYYVTHAWEKSYMSFAPHGDSIKGPIKAGKVPT